MPKALFYDPYLDTLGGGERYTLTAAKVLSDFGWQVDLAWSDPQTLEAASGRFGQDFSQIKINQELFTLFSQSHTLYSKRQAMKGYDLVFWVSDGSVPILFGKRNFLHYQVPFSSTNRPGIVDRVKLLSVHHIVVNSQFTKQVIDRTLGTTRSVVLYPPVDVDIFSGESTSKEKVILNVGRFASPSHSKRQDALIEAFRQLSSSKSVVQGWKLVLVGGHSGSDQPLLALQDQAKGLNIEFVINPDYRHLTQLYQKSQIYWHAAGFEVDEVLNPEAVEHFGMTTVEAMASGSVPVVIGKGGLKETVDIDSGYLCQSIADIVTHTTTLLTHPEILTTYSQQCRLRAQQFSQGEFAKHLLELLS